MATATSRTLFVNLGVRDLEASIEFFTKLGFAFDPRFTDEQATCLILSEEAFVMLLVADRFKEFTTKALCDAGTHTEAILAVSADSREQVDALVDTALDSGGRPANEPMNHGFMYGRSFQDVDGHLWEVIWMDPNALIDPV
jgi:predicted lactoylglutathione lyase